VTSTSEDNVVMVWQPTMRVWAGDEVKVDEKELEGDAMEGIDEVTVKTTIAKSGSGSASVGASQRSQSMSVSATASVSGVDIDDEDA
jgi:histone-binding protein RBBP4